MAPGVHTIRDTVDIVSIIWHFTVKNRTDQNMFAEERNQECQVHFEGFQNRSNSVDIAVTQAMVSDLSIDIVSKIGKQLFNITHEPPVNVLNSRVSSDIGYVMR